MRSARILAYPLLLATWAVGCAPPPDDAATEPSSGSSPTETVAQPINGALDSVSGPLRLRTFTDCKGHVQTTVWYCFTNQGEVHNAICPIGDPSYVAVGGGAWTLGGDSFPGAFIVDQFISDTSKRDGFRASSKSHVQSNSHMLIVMVIGLKVTGLSRDQLLANIREDFVSSGPSSPQPFVSVNTPPGRILLSGSAILNWFENVTPGQLMVGSWGSIGSGRWQAETTQHIQSDSLQLSMRLTSMASSIGGIDFEAFDFGTAVSSNSGLTEARVNVSSTAPTGIASWSSFNGAGRFLVKVSPEFDDSRPRDFVVQSKDHLQSDSGITFLNVVGLRQKLTGPTICVSPNVF